MYQRERWGEEKLFSIPHHSALLYSLFEIVEHELVYF